MINYTERLSLLMQDIVSRVPTLSFINVAHWSLATRVPRGFYRRGSRRLKHPYLIFQTNFNDDLDAYVDAFALVLAWRMQALWHGIANFPGPIPVDAFLKYVKDNATPVQHYYCANPAGSARIIDDAFELTRVHDRLRAAEPQMSDSQFEQAWQCFVNDNQRLL